MQSKTATLSVGQLVLPVDYDHIFANRTVLLTGMSRAGTSIMGKVVGSLANMIYLHEPVLMRYLPPLAELGHLDAALASQALQGILFEDFMLQILQGRALNLKRSENSFSGHYQELRAIKARWQRYPRRGDVLDDLRQPACCIFATKITDMQVILPLLARVFRGLKVIHIIRNGNAMISSSIRRGWFSDDYLNRAWPAWVLTTGAANVPWFIPAEDADRFARWNAETRMAYLWRFLTECGMAYGRGREDYLEIRYEELMTDPEEVVRRCETFIGTRRTPLTGRHLQAVRAHEATPHAEQRQAIEASELAQFDRLMRLLGYA